MRGFKRVTSRGLVRVTVARTIALGASSLALMVGLAVVPAASASAATAATLTLSGSLGGYVGNEYNVTLNGVASTLPDGTATVTDSNGHTCTASSWVDVGVGVTGEIYAANCNISQSEALGTTASATYAGGTNYTVASASNTVTVGALSASGPAFSGSGTSYTATVTATISVPAIDSAPTGSVGFSMQRSNCTASTWGTATPGTSGSVAIDSYSASCTLTSSSTYQGDVIASYFGTDYVTNGASFSNGLTLFGNLQGSSVNYSVTQYLPIGHVAPTGTATVSDSAGNSCTSSGWTLNGTDGFTSDEWSASCSIALSRESPGTTVSASYSNTDRTLSASNTMTVATSLAVTATAPTLSGSTYTSTATVTLTVPLGDAAPTTGVSVSDASSSTGCYAYPLTAGTATSSTQAYTASCVLTSSSSYQGDVFASYFGTDYVTNGASFSNGLTLFGTQAGTSGNSYDVYIYLPVGATGPSGNATVTDNAAGPGSCASSSWSAVGTDGGSNEEWLATCNITTAEPAGTTVSATYSNTDFTEAPSNVMTVASMQLTGTPTPLASSNSYTLTLNSPLGATPTGMAFIVDSANKFCSAFTWTAAGSDGNTTHGEYFTASCTINAVEPGGTTVTGSYEGNDFVLPTSSNSVSVGTANATLVLGGVPVTSATGNTYTLTLTASADVTPIGTATVTDNASPVGSCPASAWSAGVSNGSGGYTFQATCSITTAELAGQTVSATYTGTDYTAPTSNALTVAASNTLTVAKAAQATLTLTSTAGTVGSGLVLTASGGSGTGVVSYAVTSAGTAGCSISAGMLSATSAGTCTVTVNKAADTNYLLASSPATTVTFAQAAAQAALTLTSTSASFPSALTLTTSGGSGTGAVSYSVVNGTASGCSVSSGSLSATSAGTCLVTATKAADTTYLVASSPATTVTFVPAVVPVALHATRVNGSAVVGRTVTLTIVGTGFYGQPRITSNEAGTRAVVSHDSGKLLTVRVTVRAGSRKGEHTFTIRLANGKSCRVNYLVK